LTDQVRIERKGGELAITLARPERRNAITVAMYAALAEAFESAQDDASVRVITLRGEGQDFAAGNDIADFLEALPRQSEEIPVWRLLRALASCETPVVAAVHGNCVGIGTTILLHCDLVVADEGTRFSMPFVDLGLVPEAASTLLLPELAGRRSSARYLLLGDPFGVEEAAAIGLISHRAAPGGLETMLASMVDRLLAKPPAALRETQRLLRHGRSEEVLRRMKLESGKFTERLASPEAKEAFSAFLEKRKPDFRS
jgi:enoyl-CoA hydratase/carnithine racemase